MGHNAAPCPTPQALLLLSQPRRAQAVLDEDAVGGEAKRASDEESAEEEGDGEAL